MAKTGPKLKPEIVWSANIAYGVGLMATDGCLLSDSRHLAFVSKDLEQIQNLQECFSVTTKISRKRNSCKEEFPIYYHLQWSNKTLYNFLLQIGLTPRKSLTIGALKIPDQYFFDFLRGTYDGDGCFYSYFDSRWKSSFMFYLTFSSASHTHILWLQETLQRLCLVKGHVTRTGKAPKTTMFNLKYAKKETVSVVTQMYKFTTEIYLNRKRLKIVAALSIVGLSLPQLK